MLILWPSTQPLRKWSKQCADRDYMDVCSRFAIPGQDYCENHIETHVNKPEIVCLCGSTKYWEAFRDVGLDLTMAGIIVLSIGIAAPASQILANPESDKGKEQKKMLDWLHKRKIDLSDQILVLNVDGYIGESTSSEIQYAESKGIPVRWLFPDKAVK